MSYVLNINQLLTVYAWANKKEKWFFVNAALSGTIKNA